MAVWCIKNLSPNEDKDNFIHNDITEHGAPWWSGAARDCKRYTAHIDLFKLIITVHFVMYVYVMMSLWLLILLQQEVCLHLQKREHVNTCYTL